jgi:hypothetical protein
MVTAVYGHIFALFRAIPCFQNRPQRFKRHLTICFLRLLLLLLATNRLLGMAGKTVFAIREK